MSAVAAPRRSAKPWSRYAVGSEIDHFAQFCREHLVQSIDQWDGEPLLLEPWQRRMFGEALAYGEDGYPVWNRVVLVLPRKNGKTAALAAYALYRLLTSDGSPEILLAASSDKQAGRLFDAATTFIRRSETLSSLCRIRDHIGEITREDGLGKVFRMSSDPARLHGYNPSLVICDELAQWVTPGLRRAFAALTSGGGARSAPQSFTITTAGEAKDRDDSILGRMIDLAAKHGEVEECPGLVVSRYVESRMLVYNYTAPTDDPRDIAAMKLANPASWITKKYLAEQAANPELSDAEVLQLHGCVWAAGERHWLPGGAWQLCVDEGRVVGDGEQVCLGFDGSYNNDSTALVGCTLDGYVFVVAVWEKPEGDKGWIVPRDEVQERIRWAMDRWSVVEMGCDPPAWPSEIEEWKREYGSPPVIEFQTNRSTLMAPACSRFFSAVVNGELSHDGDQDLARHLGHAVTKETADGKYITKDGPGSPRKIDLAVAAVIAYDRAMRNPPWDGDLLEVLA